MHTIDFDHRLAMLRQRMTAVERYIQEGQTHSGKTLRQDFQELQVALEELHVADEELRHQNEELAISQRLTEIERKRYQDLFDLAPDGYLVTDCRGIIREANRAATALLGISQEALSGKPLVVFVAQDQHRFFYLQLHRLQQQPMPSMQCWEIVLQPRTGAPFPAAMTLATTHDAAGTCIGLRWLFRDMTEQKQAQMALQEAHDELERRVADRTAYLSQLNQQLLTEITERKAAEDQAQQAEQALRDSRERLRQLATYLQDTQEKERTRMARELHDDLAQILTGLTYDISWLTKQMTTVPRPWKERIQAMAIQIEELKKSVHRMGTELRPTILDDLGLLAALEWQLQQTRRRTGLRYTLNMPEEEEIPLEQARATAMFRIFQEALSNVVRHAEANHVAVRVVPHADALLLEVTDNGKGITPEQCMQRTSLGLLGMHERAALWGGTLPFKGRLSKAP